MSTNVYGDWPAVSVVIPARYSEGTICDALDREVAHD